MIPPVDADPSVDTHSQTDGLCPRRIAEVGETRNSFTDKEQPQPTGPPDSGSKPPTMASFLESSYSLVHQDNLSDVPSMSELRTQLEKGTDETKIDTMKRILTIMLNGDPMPQLLMHIIRFVMPSKSKPLKKLLYFYYEICPKLDASGKLKQEMILVWHV